MENLIDISEINNCWIVYMKPGGKDGKIEDIEEFKEICMNKKVYGLGWVADSSTGKKYIGKKLDESIIENYKKHFNDNESLEKNLKNLSNIEVNDLLITRWLDGKYYIGIVNSKVYYYPEEDSKLGWVCDVEEWFEFNEKDMPGDIVGRFSQRRHWTTQRIDNERIKLLLIKIFQESKYNKKKSKTVKIPKISLNMKNFGTALNYMDLEDLIYLYIKKENPDYILLPSQCKISKVKYEFELIEPKTQRRITCQVKNREEVDYKCYLEDANKGTFEKIYLFSGIGRYIKYIKNDNEKLDEKMEQMRKEINDSRLKIIEQDIIFKFFKEAKETEILRRRIEKYYDFKINEVKAPEGWTKVTRWNTKDKKTYKAKKDENYIFFKCDTLHYNKEFSSFIKTKGNNNKTKDEIEEQIYIEELVKKEWINR